MKRTRPQGAPTRRVEVERHEPKAANELLPTWLALAGVAGGFLLGLGLATEAGRAALATANPDEIVRIGLTAMLVAALASWTGERLGEGLLARRIDQG